MAGSLAASAQEVIVNITPVQQVLPPQAFLYVADPGRYFNITLTNLTDEAVPVYLGFQLEQTNPSSDLSISTPPSRQPQKPYTISPKGVYQLSLVEMKEMFNHLSLSEIQAPQNLFSDVLWAAMLFLRRPSFPCAFHVSAAAAPHTYPSTQILPLFLFASFLPPTVLL